MNLPILDLTTNVSQIFAELYREYNILANPPIDVFENSLYLENIQASSLISRLSQVLKDYHRDEGTLDLYLNPDQPVSKQIFTAGCGSTQLYKGLVYAMVTTFPEVNFLFVQKIPYFSGHRSAVESVFNYPNATYQGYRHPSEVQPAEGTIVVEFVTSPNNPDGEFRRPETNPDIIIGDFVFTSSSFGTDGDGYISENLEWLKQARDEGKTIFSYNSASKQFGRTADRFGYMWYPMYDPFAEEIFSQLSNFISITVGAPIQGSSHFLELLPDLVELGPMIRQDANRDLKRRMRKLSEALLQRYPGSIVTSLPGSPTWFGQISDPRINQGQTAAEVIFEDTQVRVENGSSFGEDNSFIRVNIMAYSEDINRFISRLSSKSFSSEETQRKRCQTKQKAAFTSVSSGRVILNSSDKTTHYIANPNDRSG